MPAPAVTKLPPADKLPLAVRKNIRDEWEANKGDLEQQLTTLLGVNWTIDINPNAIWPYGEADSYGKTSTGSCIKSYVEGAISRLKYFESYYGEADGLKELNEIAHAHVLTLDVDLDKKFTYCGCDVDGDGRLRILFAPTCLGTNIDYALDTDVLLKALNEANAKSEPALSFRSRVSIRQDYDSKIEELRSKMATVLSREDIKLNPNFEAVAAALRAEGKKKGNSLRDDWEQNLGGFTYLYFEALLSHLEYEKFGDDEMLSEGFNEAVEKGEVQFRIVEKLEFESYCECKVDGGVLYLQCKPATWGTNISYVASKLVDQL